MQSLPETRLCAYVASLPERALPAVTRERLAQALLDWFTAGWSGLALPGAASTRALAEEVFCATGPAPVFGGRHGFTIAGAAFVNSGVTHLREIDDAHRGALLHPGITTIAPVLALAAGEELSWRRAAAAIVAGYEVALRVGEALGAAHYARFHSTATAGALGAAAATSVALGLDAGRLHHALGLAATQAAGLWQIVDDGAHAAKPLHPAFAVRNGMTAALAARAGFPGAQAFVTGKRGLHAALGGNGPLAALDAALGEGDKICEVTIKGWPTCAQLFTALDSAKALIDEHRPDPAAIAKVEVAIYPQALAVAGVDWPRTPAEAPFSPRYCLATLIAKRRLGIAETEAPDLESPLLRQLASRIAVRAEDACGRAFPARRPCTVTFEMADGRRVTATRDLRRGDPEDPFRWDEIEDRLHAFAPDIPPATAAALKTWCRGFADPAPDERCVPAPALFGAAAV